MEIFKKASKKKLRFSTNRGVLSVEQLWDLSKDEIRQLVIKAREAAKKSSGEINDSELSFLDSPVKTKATDDELRFEILTGMSVSYSLQPQQPQHAHEKTHKGDHVRVEIRLDQLHGRASEAEKERHDQ